MTAADSLFMALFTDSSLRLSGRLIASRLIGRFIGGRQAEGLTESVDGIFRCDAELLADLRGVCERGLQECDAVGGDSGFPCEHDHADAPSTLDEPLLFEQRIRLRHRHRVHDVLLRDDAHRRQFVACRQRTASNRARDLIRDLAIDRRRGRREQVKAEHGRVAVRCFLLYYYNNTQGPQNMLIRVANARNTYQLFAEMTIQRGLMHVFAISRVFTKLADMPFCYAISLKS